MDKKVVVLAIIRELSSDHGGYCEETEECVLIQEPDNEFYRIKDFFEKPENYRKYSLYEEIPLSEMSKKLIRKPIDIDIGTYDYECRLSPLCKKRGLGRHQSEREVIRAYLVKKPSKKELRTHPLDHLFEYKINFHVEPIPPLIPIVVLAVFKCEIAGHIGVIECDEEDAECTVREKNIYKRYELEDFFVDYVPTAYNVFDFIDISPKTISIDIVQELEEEIEQSDSEPNFEYGFEYEFVYEGTDFVCKLSKEAIAKNLKKHTERRTLVKAMIIPRKIQ